LSWGLPFFALALIAFYSIANVPAYHWYFVPVAWALCLGIGLTIEGGMRMAALVQPRAVPFAHPFGCRAAATHPVVEANKLPDLVRDPDPSYVAAGRWLRANGGPTCKVGAAEVGAVAWYSGCATVDEVGLASPDNAHDLAKDDFGAWITRYAPQYILTFSPLAPFETGVREAVLDGRYAPVSGLSVPGHLVFQATGETKDSSGSLLGGDIGGGSPTLNENLYTVGGELKAGLFMHVAQSITLTRKVGTPGGTVHFEAQLGMADGAESSAGVTFIVSADGREVLRQVVKPGKWNPVSVDVPVASDGTVTIQLATDIAPGGSTNFGWAVWGTPKLVAP
jgi:hypothetical protein